MVKVGSDILGFTDTHALLLLSLMEPILVEEVIYEILSWLPVKSLIRFICVCKAWKSIISDPNFIQLHLHRSSTNPYLLLTSENLDRFAISCSMRSLIHNPISPVVPDYELELTNDLYIGVSCNGLVSLISHSYRDGFHVYSLRLWNPATRLMSQNSPRLLVNEPHHQFEHAEFGLGYDDLNDTYTVVAVLIDKKATVEISERTQVSVYSFGGDRYWRRIQSFPIFPIPQQQERKCVKGSFNWLALRNYDADYEWENVTVDQLVIVSLDLSKETYTQLSLPSGFDEKPYFEPAVWVLMDSLCFSHDYKGKHFVVWQMKEFGVESSWTPLVNVSYDHLLIDTSEEFFNTIPLCSSENGDVLMLTNFGYCRAILYNRRNNGVEWTGNKDINWIMTQDYVQSLVSPR